MDMTKEQIAEKIDALSEQTKQYTDEWQELQDMIHTAKKRAEELFIKAQSNKCEIAQLQAREDITVIKQYLDKYYYRYDTNPNADTDEECEKKHDKFIHVLGFTFDGIDKDRLVFVADCFYDGDISQCYIENITMFDILTADEITNTEYNTGMRID